MYSPSPFRPALGNPFAQMYSRVAVETSVDQASPHRLIAMLFDGLMDAMAQARGAMLAGQVEAKGRAIGRAVRIIEEGLRCSLDLKGGGTLAQDLQDLYNYVSLRLTQANARNDVAVLDECRALMQPVQDAWNTIAPQVAGAQTAEGVR